MDDVEQGGDLWGRGEGFEGALQQAFIAHQRHPDTSLFDGEKCPGDQFLVAMVTSHGIQGYPHSSLLGYIRIEDEDGAPPVLAALAA